MGDLPVSRTRMYVEDAIKWVLLKKCLPFGPANDLLSRIKSGRAEVIGLSLGRIIDLRRGDLCSDKELAFADHYLQARAMVAHLGPLSLGPTWVVVVGYETKKLIWERLGILDKMTSDKQCPSPVSPDALSISWGLRGAQDGFADYSFEHPNWAGKMRR